MTYASDFTEYQLNQFDQHFKKVMKAKLMSFYSYLTYHYSNNQKIQMSIDELTDRWNNKHKKKGNKKKCVCRATMYNWIKKLQAANLLKINEDAADTFIYTLISEKSFLDGKLDENLDKEKVPSFVENTNVSANENCDNTLSFNYSYDYDSNSVATFDKAKYIQEQEKCSWELACDIMSDAFVKLKITSKWVKSTVIEKIIKYHSSITRKHAEAYIVKTIKNVSKDNENSYKQRVIGNGIDLFNNFPQRTNYDFDALEKALLGWG